MNRLFLFLIVIVMTGGVNAISVEEWEMFVTRQGDKRLCFFPYQVYFHPDHMVFESNEPTSRGIRLEVSPGGGRGSYYNCLSGRRYDAARVSHRLSIVTDIDGEEVDLGEIQLYFYHSAEAQPFLEMDGAEGDYKALSPAKSLVIEHIDIYPEYQKQGYGSVTLKTLLSAIKEWGHPETSKVMLQYYTCKPYLKVWYEKYGFVCVENEVKLVSSVEPMWQDFSDLKSYVSLKDQ